MSEQIDLALGPPPLRPSKVLARAEEVLHERQWCRGQLGLDEKREPRAAVEFIPGARIAAVCTMGAIVLASVELTGVAYPRITLTPSPEQAMLRATIKGAVAVAERALVLRRMATPESYPPVWNCDIPVWNDHFAGSKEEVAALLSEAKVLAEETEG